MNTSLEDRVKKLVMDQLKITENVFSFELAIGDVPEWDSAEHIRLLQNIEDEFSVSIDVTDAIEIEDVQDIIITLRKYEIK